MLTQKCDILLSTYAFKFNLRRYTKADPAKGTTHEKVLKLTFRMPTLGVGGVGGATATEEALGGSA